MIRQLRAVVLSGFILLSSLAMLRQVGAQNTPPKKPAQPVSNQMTNIPYYTLRDGMSSTLTLNNLTQSAMPVTVTIYNEQGKGQILKPITLDPHSFKQIELSDVVVGDDFGSGNVEIAFNGINMAVTSQVSIYSLANRVSFESREADMMDFESAKFAGILSLPKGADGFLAVTNTSANKITAQLTAGSLKKTIVLFPRETDLVKLNDGGNGQAPTATLVTLQHSGLPGDLITTGYVLNLKDGYSSAFTMSDPGILRSNKLAGAHFRAGQPDPSEGFPEATQFHSSLLLANISAQPVTAHVSVDYTLKDARDSQGNGNDAPKNGAATVNDTVAKVKDLTIAPGGVETVELSDALGGVGTISEAGVDIAYDAAPGSLIGQLTSVDQSGDYSFEVPIKDPADPSAMVESAYPWTTQNGTDTVLHLKNTTDKSVSALAIFVFPDGGGYSPDRIVLDPHQSIAIDIQKLKDTKKPDVAKQIFPANEGHGLLFWHQETPASMIGRAEQTNVKEGIARSFSCNSGCCDNFSFYQVVLSPSSLTGDMDGSGAFQGYEQYTNCLNETYPNQPNYPLGYPMSAASWAACSSTCPNGSDTYVASVDYSGNVSYVGGGTATVTGDFQYPEYYWDGLGCQKSDVKDDYYAYGTVTVTEVGSLSISIFSGKHVYSGDPIVSTCDGTTWDPNASWGYSHHIDYQLKDISGNNISGGSYTLTERLYEVSQNPSGQGLGPAGSETFDSSGVACDFQAYWNNISPGPTSGQYHKILQDLDVKDNTTGHTYTAVRVNCVDLEYNDVTITDITSGGSCS